jgi:polysaccharide biosynthesis protein cpsM(V)
MIPKKIHYCWLSEDEMPEKLQKCLESWKKHLPDYEIVKWDLNRFPLEKSVWVNQAFERKKYAFAADYIRLYALVTEGGIYLDSDVEVLKSYDDLLNLPYFICSENSPGGIEAATLGAEKDCQWLKECIKRYDDRPFVKNDGSLDTQVLPIILEKYICQHYNMVKVNTPLQVKRDEHNIYVLPYDFFSPKSYTTKKISITGNTYSIHHFAGSWQPMWKKMLLYIWVPFKALYFSILRKK